MDATTLAQLEAFWSWTAGVATIITLGVLLPFSFAMLIGALRMGAVRRDWRLVSSAALIVGLAAASGAALAFGVRSGAPSPGFWLMLSLEIGLLVLPTALVTVLRRVQRRIKEHRLAVAAVSAPAPSLTTSAMAIEPGPRARLNAVDAEYYVAEWMRALGALDAIVTPARRDGGVDVRSSRFVAQVKHRSGDFVSVDVVRAIHGVAREEGRQALVFTSGRYSRDAGDFAGRAGIGLFIFIPQSGRLVAANTVAQRLRQEGLGSPAVYAHQP